MIIKNNRLRELDFLRGIAILLVLMRHQLLFEFTRKMGWIGVDLFFVLSGFLVSGLLFKEYLRYGNIKPGLFLIRRGFKIYPIYYLSYFLYLAPKIAKHQFELKGFLADLFFVQNYVWGWGYAYVPTWSLAVEEHFYFGFAAILFFVIKRNAFHFKETSNSNKLGQFEMALICVMVFCLVMRLISNVYFLEDEDKNITMSHLRIDSLLAGVFISYLYYFKNKYLTHFFSSYKTILMISAFVLVAFTPFIDFEESFFVRTFGFTFLYVSFGIVLLYFLLEESINIRLDKLFSKHIVDSISKIGFSSYSIYIIHGVVNFVFSVINVYFLKIEFNSFFVFFVTSAISIFTGIFMTTHIEKYFLTIRNKRFPSRIN
ncbi:Peptidoglycan/LPS O-acetylase OafA/YrhL, contains acyltransferase and SGNH-hydrolase domains [Flavobacterium fluvii]|uniref:Peptidoglycan/LPS O-acetylase OafA/YrhL, contains acyltransferase and SGNH-hydrolase domains n=1 Tax=Flavobacterium fluvii TaxID=468056 RepID=A0A1M5IRV6_9FLAO|nr:acyltransferase [Flavobacterium fluvii]SHG30729.1 Peptidoglycan/LPS O-acetylase OafA/YrhL, contains acyltransferase and SGNH-hydrolase domains [Flavobacterium fluvii]